VNGPEHYAEAERLANIAEAEILAYAKTNVSANERHHVIQARWAQQQAQVHATLALAAASADAAVQRYIGDENTTDREWTQAIA
jgi:hypothetical protein